MGNFFDSLGEQDLPGFGMDKVAGNAQALWGTKKKFKGVRPSALKFEDLNVKNTQVVDENGNVRDQYKSGFDSLLPQYQTELDKINLNTDALQKLRERALGSGDSAWLQLQKANLQNSLGDMRDSATAQQGTGYANTLSSLARSGGLSGGASERAARQNSSDYNKARQQIARYGSSEANNLAIKEDEMKTQMLGQVQGLESQALQPQIMKSQAMLGQMGREQDLGFNSNQNNIQRALDELAQKRQFDMQTYSEQMKEYAADRTAFAQANAGGKKGGGKGGGK